MNICVHICIFICVCVVCMTMHRHVIFMYNVYVEKRPVIKNETKYNHFILLASDASYI